MLAIYATRTRRDGRSGRRGGRGRSDDRRRRPRRGDGVDMTVRHRFECVHCGHRIHVSGADSEAARQAARERGAEHVNEAHQQLLVRSPGWPDELAPGDVLTGDAAYGSLRGWLGPADDLLVCADCGYRFDGEGGDADRAPVGERGLVCERCHDRRLRDDDPVGDAIDDFLR